MGTVLAHRLSRIPQLNAGNHERAIRNLARWEEDTVSGERGVMPAPAARKRASSRSSFPGFLLEARGNDEKERGHLRNPRFFIVSAQPP